LITLAIKFVALLGFAVMFFWTLITGREEVPLTERTQIIAVAEDQVAALGEQAFRDVLQKHRVVGSGADAERVGRITGRIAAAADAITEKDYRWEVALLDAPSVNAFALPGGKVAVLSGLLEVARTDDQLAAVVGHEVGHVLARHGAERMTQEQLAQYGRLAVGVAIGDLDPATQSAVLGALGMGAQFGILMPFSRKHETEADRIGLILMARACFDPRAAREVWANMAQAAGEGPPEILSTHPSHASRVAALDALMQEAMAEREEAGCPALPEV
jgi:predicted Zn-dependent protease